MKITREDLIKENAVLQDRIVKMDREDFKTRTVLSELLDSYEWDKDFYGARTEKKVITRDWIGIAFLIGELKADANYSMLIESREELRKQNQNLIQEIEYYKSLNKQNGSEKI